MPTFQTEVRPLMHRARTLALSEEEQKLEIEKVKYDLKRNSEQLSKLVCYSGDRAKKQ